MNRTKTFIVILIIIFLVFLGIQQYMIWTTPKEENPIIGKLNEIELKLDSISELKDSVIKRIDSTHIKIITNEKYYKERIDVIIHQSSSADSSFVANYIRQYANKNSLPYIK